MTQAWSQSCANTQIKNDVEDNKTLTCILDFFFPQQNSERPEKSVKFITTTFQHWLSIFLPEKGKKFIYQILNDEILDGDYITQWIDVVYGHKSNIQLYELLQKSEFYKQFEDLKVHEIEYDLTRFCHKLRFIFRECFLETKNLRGILEIYQVLIYCNAKTKRSIMFCETIKKLWKKLNFETSILNLVPVEEADDEQHIHLQKLVDNFEGSDNFIIYEKIKELFQNDNTTFTVENQKLIILSYKIVMSEILEETKKKIANNLVNSIEITAKEIILDVDVKFRGKNLTLISNDLFFPYDVVIELSGKHACNMHDAKPVENGKEAGEDGKNGEDGIPGQSSGNCTIKTKTATNIKNLKVLLNGGNGSKGQDGGNGANGENGKGLEFEKVSGAKHKLFKYLKTMANVVTIGSYSLIFDSENVRKSDDGSVIFSNDSSNYFSTHFYRLFTGSDGKPGGKGGKNGLGGEGGKNGDFKLSIDGRDVVDSVEVLSFKGHNGLNGKVGENGDAGLEGWDIALFGRTGKPEEAFGTEKNEKLEIQYFQTEEIGSVYVHDRNNLEHDFQCYAKIIPRALQRSNLRNEQSEKTQEKSESERKGKSIARKSNPIDEEAANEKFQELTQSVLNEEMQNQEECEIENEESTEINRLYEVFDFKFEEEKEYQPKKRYEPKEISTEEIKEIEKAKEGWNKLFKFPAPSCYSFKEKIIKKIPGETVKDLLTKKKIIGNLRRENDEEENMEKSFDDLVSEFEEEFEESFGNLISTEAQSMDVSLKNLLAYTGQNGTYLLKKLKLLYFKNNKMATFVVNTLLMVFECEGMHVDLLILNFLIETILFFEESNFSPYSIPCILLPVKQSEWLDELFMVTVDFRFALISKQKLRIKNVLKEFNDENLKILFCEKLRKTNGITEYQTQRILESLKSEKTICPILENADLQEWIFIIEEHVSKNSTINKYDIEFRDDEMEKKTIFWHGKLKEFYDPKIIEPLFPIIAKLVLSFDKQIIGRFFQRLCCNEVVCGNVTNENVESILRCTLNIHCNLISNHDDEIYNITKELLNDTTKIVQKQKALHQLCQKMNQFDECTNLFEMITFYPEEIIQNEIIKCYEMLKNNVFSYDFSLKAFEKILNSCQDGSAVKHDLFLLTIIDKIINDKCGFHLRDNQKLAILNALNNKNEKNKTKSVLQQISTGEGKTLIIAALSIILVLKSQKRLKINVVTSSSVLAKREADPQNIYFKLYEAFGIKVGHICHNSQRIRTETYTSCEIIYGDLTMYQSDFLQDNYLSKNVLGERGFDVVIVDEVDSMLLDNGLNMLYLSHEVAELELLQPIFSKIWQLTNLRLNGDFGDISDEEFYQKVCSSFFPNFSWLDFPVILNISDSDAELFKSYLISKEIVSETGRIIAVDKNDIERIFLTISDIDEKIKNKFLCFHSSILNENYITVPSNLQLFVLNHLQEFIKNAEAGYEMKEGINYQIETISNFGSKTIESKIVIIDRSTGVDLPTTQWTKGLHQFIQIKHGLQLTPISTKAFYISNVSYLKKF